MGVKIGKTYRLVFEDGPYAGVVVRMRGMSVDQLLALGDLAEAAARAQAGGTGGTVEIASVGHLCDAVAAGLIEWNVDGEDDTPVTADRAGLGSVDFGFLIALTTEWMTAAAGVPGPLVDGSTSGPPALEASIPMEVATSPSLAS